MYSESLTKAADPANKMYTYSSSRAHGLHVK